LEVTRDEVHIFTVRASFMLDDATGYVQLKDFGENTEREIRQSLRDLTDKGMRRLVLDLRGNPGGPLDQAIKVANLFLPRDRMIVYTRGRTTSAARDYRGSQEGEFIDLPTVVLTSRRSASASEIVAGALQDHDRALIVGETTFGKALVQSVYGISGGAGLALTTAHYYTPSGRLIQRPWDASFDEYLSYEMRDQDVNKAHNPGDLKRTDSGRPVYSGGGIEPDRHIAGPIEGFNPTAFGRTLQVRQTFDTYAQKFTAAGDTRVSQQAVGRWTVTPGFVVDDSILADFKEFLRNDRLRVDEEAFAKDTDFIRAMLRARINEAVFSIAEAQRQLVGVDPQVRLAVSLFGEVEKLRAQGGTGGRAN
jgi:carboxyl-terminal processing protease